MQAYFLFVLSLCYFQSFFPFVALASRLSNSQFSLIIIYYYYRSRPVAYSFVSIHSSFFLLCDWLPLNASKLTNYAATCINFLTWPVTATYSSREKQLSYESIKFTHRQIACWTRDPLNFAADVVKLAALRRVERGDEKNAQGSGAMSQGGYLHRLRPHSLLLRRKEQKSKRGLLKFPEHRHLARVLTRVFLYPRLFS